MKSPVLTLPARLERISTMIERIAGLFLAAITIIVSASAIGRYLLSMPIPDAFDVSRLMMGVAILWGLASVGYRGSHIKVDLLAEILPARIRRWIDIFAWTVLLVFTCLFAWMLMSRVGSYYASGQVTSDLRMPIWPFFALMWLGVAASVLTVFLRIVLMLLDPRRGLDHYERLDADDAGENAR
ncbi:TRAP-type mannitol/chloroaromatic compound transport system permease small subunit [Breoghania corrubedonensis]|uniref:TRAP transporter small permease protein n=1 Tax=Breoghania corrubedonensis TaxID=665038 RepID=A0A2T5UN69_9HYPH|nr:TRAP transporter small permease [Breoghania corrubedonensis]PTW52947.1 TRAP-type mannitol/chloroaromatic compound transport system permease small subunit [Breoghania corrubedonensis]